MVAIEHDNLNYLTFVFPKQVRSPPRNTYKNEPTQQFEIDGEEISSISFEVYRFASNVKDLTGLKILSFDNELMHQVKGEWVWNTVHTNLDRGEKIVGA